MFFVFIPVGISGVVCVFWFEVVWYKCLSSLFPRRYIVLRWWDSLSFCYISGSPIYSVVLKVCPIVPMHTVKAVQQRAFDVYSVSLYVSLYDLLSLKYFDFKEFTSDWCYLNVYL